MPREKAGEAISIGRAKSAVGIAPDDQSRLVAQSDKETKLLLKLVNYRGIEFLVNNEFRSAPPSIVIGIIRSIMQEKERYRSIDGVVYLTNHYIKVSKNGSR